MFAVRHLSAKTSNVEVVGLSFFIITSVIFHSGLALFDVHSFKMCGFWRKVSSGEFSIRTTTTALSLWHRGFHLTDLSLLLSSSSITLS